MVLNKVLNLSSQMFYKVKHNLRFLPFTKVNSYYESSRLIIVLTLED